MMEEDARAAWFEALPEGIRRQVDGYVLQGQDLPAIRIIAGVGLVTAQLVVGDRSRHYGDRVARRPDDPLDLESLVFRAAGIRQRIVAIEAVWDGDTVHDWFVRLLAVLDPAPGEQVLGEQVLAVIPWGAAERYLGDVDSPGHPSAVAAERSGRALAEHLGVPFHFGSPDQPDDEAPRWRP
ncbi:hypothetical protein [Actinoplanes couchii]|uniref:Uncharacterized protein n=1 Tax=Actinoplanes couchii TaxID=403638 RepID=A0ABQ3XNR7_9ACTN|nr:hypothetical protein [Actinoplanes couchii]MDR6319657.1 hypothetical protein [Actinoplanes couchii]GID60123.1 hypothetical protein Aco03nite_085270 [Actinoplanes couchii]